MTREETVEYAIKFFNRRLREPVLQYGERQAIHIAISALREQKELESKLRALESSGWISVEERLPQETGEVCRVVNLMMDNGLVTSGWLNDITGLGYFLDSRSSFVRQAPISRFTHWMPLPETPKEEV